MNLPEITKNIRNGQILSEEEMSACMTLIMEGKSANNDLGDFLTALARRGETAEEITGAARVLRKKASMITAPENAVDCCGTGGDGLGTYNVSTAVALVCAASGIPVAKHGNRASSSKSGAADVLKAIGVNLDVEREKLERALHDFNFCFLMAPAHHQAMKHVKDVRKQLGFRTIFNLLGPLANPAGTKIQLIGVYDEKWLTPMAGALKNLGSEKAWIVHGSDGLDEITITGATQIAIMDQGQITETRITPSEFGLKQSPIEDLKGGDAKENASALSGLLEGAPSAYRDIVIANSAAVIALSQSEADLRQSSSKAAEAIDSGAALDLLQRYKDFVRA